MAITISYDCYSDRENNGVQPYLSITHHSLATYMHKPTKSKY